MVLNASLFQILLQNQNNELITVTSWKVAKEDHFYVDEVDEEDLVCDHFCMDWEQ